MCGFVGILEGKKSTVEADRALDAISHRGPDGRGWWADNHQPGLSLGHTRLSIVDLSPAGAQPMTSASGRWVLAYNGEIYNHLELRHRFLGGHDFRGHADTETLIELIDRLGVSAAVASLNGIFAFAAFDKEKRELFLVRDAFGVKPVYAAIQGDSLYFGSEVRALEAVGCRVEPSPDQVASFLMLRHVPSPSTMFEGIERLPAGAVWRCRWDGCPEIERTRVERRRLPRRTDTVDRLEREYVQRLDEAVGGQLMSDVDVGVLLSGGIDSGLLAAIAASHQPELRSYTVGFADRGGEDEIDAAAETAAILGIPNRAVRVTSEELWGALESSVRAVEEPVGAVSVIPMWHLAKLAAEEVKVVLAGQGADEPWGGYRRYQFEYLRGYAPEVNLPGISRLRSRLENLLGPVPDRVRRTTLAITASSRAARFVDQYAPIGAGLARDLTGVNAYEIACRGVQSRLEDIPEGLSSVEAMMYIDTSMGLSDELLLYGDKISMAHSLEMRVPMLDPELVAFVESLPTRMKIRALRGKWLHKRVATSRLPPEVVYRKKRSFEVPFGRYVRGPWRERVRARLLDPGQPHLNFLHRETIETILNDHQGSRPDASIPLFCLLTLSVWTAAWQRGG